MNRRRFALALIPLAALPVLAAVAITPPANAHGSLQNPISRTYACYLEGPESPDSAACRAAIAVGGTQPLYDWNEVHILDAAGRHRELIPDGKLCSAGLAKYAGFDLARADWSATTLPSGGGSYTFSYRATAPHRGSFEFYLTRPGYDPLQPLRWSDLEATPFLRATDPPLSGGAYTMDGQLPAGRTGRHLIYTIWQRSDSPEAFYTCSDVVFGSAPSTSPTSTAPASPTPSPSASPTTSPGAVSAWQPNTAYAIGARVSYGGRTYQCRQAHTSLVGWEPPNVPALWQPV